MPGMGKSKGWWRTYHALRLKGASKATAAKIANSPKRKRKPQPSRRKGRRYR